MNKEDEIVRIISNTISIIINLILKLCRPIMFIWLCDNLFKTSIEYSLWNWWVIFVTHFVFNFKLDLIKKKKNE